MDMQLRPLQGDSREYLPALGRIFSGGVIGLLLSYIVFAADFSRYEEYAWAFEGALIVDASHVVHAFELKYIFLGA